MSQINPQILQIIGKHIGSKVSVIYKDSKTVIVHGKLLNLNAEKIQVNDMNLKQGNIVISFFDKMFPKILAIYNVNGLNILNPRNNEHLGAKLRKKDLQMVIISAMKPNLNKNVSVVFKKLNNVNVINGQLSNMGMVDLMVKLAPFYNEEQTLKYDTIMNVFDEQGNDLIEIN
jgi:hypothetical protein